METKKVAEEKTAVKEVKNTNEKVPEVVFSIVVLENGVIIVQENGKPVTNVQKIEFVADGKEIPKYTITKGIPSKR